MLIPLISNSIFVREKIVVASYLNMFYVVLLSDANDQFNPFFHSFKIAGLQDLKDQKKYHDIN